MKIQLLFVDFRGSSHAILEQFCFLRDGIAPGSVRRILHRVNLHVISRFASFLYHLLLFFLFACSLFHFLGFNDLPGRPFWFPHFLVLDRIFHRKFGVDWWTLHPPRAVVCRPRQTRGCSHPKGTLRFTEKALHQDYVDFTLLFFSFRYCMFSTLKPSNSKSTGF